MNVPFSAVLLAGGASRRMGQDKALLPVDGRPLWRRQEAVLREAGATEIFFSVRPDQSWIAEGCAKITDKMPDQGPLAGLAAALAVCNQPHLLVLAVDLPRMQAGYLKRLLAQRSPGLGVVPELEGHFEPLVAVYPRELLVMAEEALGRKQLSLQSLVAGAIDAGLMTAVPVTGDEADLFTNWNLPGDFIPPEATAPGSVQA